jgi:hypothetical protein
MSAIGNRDLDNWMIRIWDWDWWSADYYIGGSQWDDTDWHTAHVNLHDPFYFDDPEYDIEGGCYGFEIYLGHLSEESNHLYYLDNFNLYNIGDIYSGMTADVWGAALATTDIYSSLSTGATLYEDSITEGLIKVGDLLEHSDGSWYDGKWGTEIQPLGSELFVETNEKTTGAQSVRFYPYDQGLLNIYYLFDSKVDVLSYGDGIRFDMKLDTKGGSPTFYVLLWDRYFQSKFYENIPFYGDGEWHTYSIQFANYTTDGGADLSQISSVVIVADDGSNANKYIDEFTFFTYDNVSATMTVDGIYATLTTEDTQ